MSRLLASAIAASPLHTESSGQGSPLVLWHGWGMNLRVFDTLRAALNDGWRSIAVDLPGHGHSSWDDGGDEMLSRLLTTLPAPASGSPPVTLVGWSLGGQLALRAAALAPQGIARLVLIGTTPRFLRADSWPHGAEASALHAMQARLATDYRGAVSDFLELQVRGSRDAGKVQRALRTAVFGHGAAQPAALAASLTLLAATDLRPQLAAIRLPTLVIAGQYDRVTPAAASAALAAALPQATYLEIARAAHAPFLSHLEQLLPTLRNFINGSRPP